MKKDRDYSIEVENWLKKGKVMFKATYMTFIDSENNLMPY